MKPYIGQKIIFENKYKGYISYIHKNQIAVDIKINLFDAREEFDIDKENYLIKHIYIEDLEIDREDKLNLL